MKEGHWNRKQYAVLGALLDLGQGGDAQIVTCSLPDFNLLLTSENKS